MVFSKFSLMNGKCIKFMLNPPLSGSLLQVRTVTVSNVSLGASEQDIKEFFSFSGEIEYIELLR